MIECRICNNSINNKSFSAKEMMYGSREKFNYFLCSDCGCLQITEIPKNMNDYYPNNYYSYEKLQRHNYYKYQLVKIRNRYGILRKGFLGKILFNIFPQPDLKIMGHIGVDLNTSVLDVGSGSGSYLKLLHDSGLKSLLGIDPLIDADKTYENGFSIKKRSIHDQDGNWDLVMFHHSFEHLIDPLETLQSVNKILKKDGICLIRIPIIPSIAWEKYGVDWVQLDAPRHIYIYSIESLRRLTVSARLYINEIIYDSNGFQFWGSEQYLKNIPLFSKNSYSVNPDNSIFSSKDIKKFSKIANELNKNGGADQAIFIIKKS